MVWRANRRQARALSSALLRVSWQNLGLYTPPDPTYGRYTLGVSDREKELEADPAIQVRQRRIFVKNGLILNGEDVKLTQAEIIQGKEWLYYKTWQRGPGNGSDVIVLHGIYAYGGRWAAHVTELLRKGFRIIAPDMPAHGRSTGLHAYIPNHTLLLDALESVILDMDTYSNARRKIFLVGSSMGGGIILNFCTFHLRKERVSGIYVLSPMITVPPETMPNALIQFIAQITKFFAGRYAIASIIKGKGTDDPRIEEDLQRDPRIYNGKMRIATGLSMLQCMLEFTPSVIASFSLPFRIVHGTHDRVTSYKGSLAFYDSVASKDKEKVLYEGAQHIMLKSIGNERDETTEEILRDMADWLTKRV